MNCRNPKIKNIYGCSDEINHSFWIDKSLNINFIIFLIIVASGLIVGTRIIPTYTHNIILKLNLYLKSKWSLSWHIVVQIHRINLKGSSYCKFVAHESVLFPKTTLKSVHPQTPWWNISSQHKLLLLAA